MAVTRSSWTLPCFSNPTRRKRSRTASVDYKRGRNKKPWRTSEMTVLSTRIDKIQSRRRADERSREAGGSTAHDAAEATAPLRVRGQRPRGEPAVLGGHYRNPADSNLVRACP